MTLAFIVALMLAAAADNAMAWSCREVLHRYVLQCSAQKCSDAFFVAQVSAFGRCGRRDEVMEIDAEARRFVAELAQVSGLVGEDGIYVMRIPASGMWRPEPRGSREGLIEQFESSGRWRRNNPDVPLRSMSPSALAAELQGATGDWLRRDGRFTTLDAARSRLRLQAWGEYAISVLMTMAYAASVLIPLILLVRSTGQYFARLHGGQRSTWRALAVPVGVQLGVLALTLVSIAIDGAVLWVGIVLAPAVVVILIAEGAAWLKQRKVRGVNSPVA